MDEDSLPDPDRLELLAQQALYRVEQTWMFIHGKALPDNIERSVRALVFRGANATTIVGAITIAAQKIGLHDDNQWVYVCGIVRNELEIRGENQPATQLPASCPAPTQMSLVPTLSCREEVMTTTCPNCSTSIEQKPRGRRREYCSKACGVAYRSTVRTVRPMLVARPAIATQTAQGGWVVKAVS